MMPTDEQLTAAFDKGMREGPENLVGPDRDYYLIQDFILEWESGFLTGYLYNRIPDFASIRAAIDSMRRHGAVELGSILSQALELFEGYQEPDPPSTWEATLRRYDPTGRLAELDRRIMNLQSYGMNR